MEGKGPTPKAVDRPYHPAAKAARQAAHKAATTNGRPGGRPPVRRKSTGETEWIAGRNSIVEALRAELPVTGIYVASRLETDDRVREILKIAGDRGIPLLEASRQDLDRFTDGAVHQGVAATVPPYDYQHPMDLLEAAADSGRPALVVALDGVTDPRNLGAVVRSVAAFGGHGVVVPERRAAGMTASAWKTSAGAAARVPVARAANLNRAIEEYQKAGLFVVGLDADGDVDLPDLQLADGPLVVVVGAEGAGLSRLVREKCDQVVSIPMAGAVESLNAGVAAGIALYEVARHR
nr:23S rRNA (guanosine(2251)-2'-O)-methyltransferase RlmB [Kineococcus aurantiacus]